MEQQMEEGKSSSSSAGVKVYNPTSAKPISKPATPEQPGLVRLDHNQGRKRKMVANGVQKTLSKTSMLGNFLPTGTLLAFEMVLPSIYRTGECSHVTKLMMTLLLTLCTLSCFFFHFTDSFKGHDGKVFYGFVTPRGLAVFKPDLGMPVPRDEKYRLSLNDVVHALMSVMVFVSIAFSDHRVAKCLFPGKEKEMYEVMESFPLMVGLLCSGLFLVFPTTRHGIGCMAT
uniref:Uncharacterized protein n=1 Tax=Kalanchoe fedtschenkoi TaxID=63787 RepID=A0A7N0UWG4_KALFE